MKAIKVLLDEELLERLDNDPEVQCLGRSAILRQAAVEYLEHRRREAIREQYRQAYADGGGLGGELEGWEDQGVWPPEARTQGTLRRLGTTSSKAKTRIDQS